MAKINWLVDMCEPSFSSMQHLMINKSVIVKKNIIYKFFVEKWKVNHLLYTVHKQTIQYGISYSHVHILHFVYSFNVDKLICCIKSDFPLYLKDLIHDAEIYIHVLKLVHK